MIIAKAGSKQEIEDKLNKGADLIELQLLDKNTENFIEYSNKIYSVHTMIDNISGRVITLEDNDMWNREKLDEAFYIANTIGEKENKHIGVIVHNGLGYSKLFRLGVFELCYTKLERALHTYKYTKAFIKNSSVINSSGIYGIDIESNELVEVIKKLKDKSYYSDRIYGLLDIVHAMSSSRLLEMTYGTSSLISYEDYFKEYANIIKEIHFGNIVNLGLNSNEYKVIFDDTNKSDKEFLKLSVDLINKYMSNIPICVDIHEDNSLNAVNFEKIVKMLKLYIQ